MVMPAGSSFCLPFSQLFAEFEWARADTIFKGDFGVMDEGIHPTDISQRSLGDCYFIAAICAISENEDRIKKLFISQKRNEQGVYCVTFCVTGTWEHILLDDYFVIDPQCGYRSAFSCSRDNQIWMMLLLKAWAKIYGGYLNVCGGTTLEVLPDLTGAPSAHFDPKIGSEEYHWEVLMDASDNEFIMCASTPVIEGVGSNGIDEKTGLVSDHA